MLVNHDIPEKVNGPNRRLRRSVPREVAARGLQPTFKLQLLLLLLWKKVDEVNFFLPEQVVKMIDI